MDTEYDSVDNIVYSDSYLMTYGVGIVTVCGNDNHLWSRKWSPINLFTKCWMNVNECVTVAKIFVWMSFKIGWKHERCFIMP